MLGLGRMRKRNVSVNSVSVAPVDFTDLDWHSPQRSSYSGMGHPSCPLYGMTKPELLYFTLWMLVFLFGGRRSW